ncbi:MAG: hydroxymethylbilane synthase [Candidatus Omnitrophota bacterium]|nr:hydroxymethylbilane synthase [Candidatus Omnitrophota bacterium]
MKTSYKIGTRKSPLALKQVQEVLDLLKGFYSTIRLETIAIDTYGDKDKATPISEIEGSDFFTKEIDDLLLTGEVDFAIHSAKDLPESLSDGLVIAARTKAIDPYDVLVSKQGLTLDKLPYGAKIATSSLRRKDQLKKYRDDFEIVDIRGNIEERLEKLDNSDLDAIVLASAGLMRLGLAHKITQRITFKILDPHPLQGALAIVTRSKDLELLDLLRVLDSREKVLS